MPPAAAMPMHDWTRAGSYLYPHFHTYWLTAICRVLNNGLLPAGYSALVEQVSRLMPPDVLPVHVAAESALIPEQLGTSAGRVRYRATAAPLPVWVRTTRLAIRHSNRRRRVAVVELLSPGIKSSRETIRRFVWAMRQARYRNIHVLSVDPLPPGNYDPNGVHALVWEELGAPPFALPADQPLTLAA